MSKYVFKRLNWIQGNPQKFLPGQDVPANLPVEVIEAWMEDETIAVKHGNKPKEEHSSLDDFTVSELSDLLRAEGLPIRGTKAEKIARLEDFEG